MRAAGATDVKLDATRLFVDATMSAPRAARVFSTPLAVFHAARLGRFVAPTHAARVPAALQGLVTTVVGLDTRSLTGKSYTHASKGVRAKAKTGVRSRCQGSRRRRPAVLGGAADGLPVGLRAGFGGAGLHAQSVRDRVRLRALVRMRGSTARASAWR